jgi:RNA polymerase sigma factor (sigma-70 family)
VASHGPGRLDDLAWFHRQKGTVLTILLETYFAQRGGLKRLLRARLGSEEEAEDLVQEMYLRLQRGSGSGDVQNPAGYLFKMALNLALDHQRARRRSSARDGQWVEVTRIRLGDDDVADLPSAETAYGAKQRLAVVMAAIEELPPHARRVFTMHKFEGLTHPEIAAKLGISRGTVEKHMTTALKHLIARVGSG